MGTKNLARLYVGVCKADKTDRNGGQPSTCCLCTLQFPHIIPGLVPTGFTNLLISFDILLESTRFLKMASIRFFYRRYVDDIFLLFKSNDHLKYFQDFLNSCHSNMSFSMETEKENKLSFLDVEVIREQGNFTTTVYRKPTFSDVYSSFKSFLP